MADLRVDRRATGPFNVLRRLWVEHWKGLALTLLASVTMVAVAYVKGVFAAPGQVNVLAVKVDTLTARLERQREEFREVATATWTFVALRCLELDDSAFVNSRLPCGKAFESSGIVTRRLLR